MKKTYYIILYLFLSIIFLTACSEGKTPGKDFNIIDYGAKVHNADNSSSINKAINSCSKNGGGRVVIPAGTFFTSAIILKSDVNIHFEKGAIIKFSKNQKDYRSNIKALIYGNKLENISFTGTGTIDGSGEAWRPVKKDKVTLKMWDNLLSEGGKLTDNGKTWWPTAKGETKRPYLLSLAHCKKVHIDGVTIENSPMFNIYINNSNDVAIENTKISNEFYAQNTDGIDISACKNVTLSHDDIDTGDDGICMKSSGENSKGPRLMNINIHDCTVHHAHGGFVIGSNTDGGMKNIHVINCDFIGTDYGIKIKTDDKAGGKIEDINIDNIKMRDIVNSAININTDYTSDGKSFKGQNIPTLKDINISNVWCSSAKVAFDMNVKHKESVQSINFNNINISTKEDYKPLNMENIKLTNVNVTKLISR